MKNKTTDKRTPAFLYKEILENGFIPTTDASIQFGVTNDYIGYLCRHEKVSGFFVGRLWFVSRESLKFYLAKAQVEREKRRNALSTQLRKEYYENTGVVALPIFEPEKNNTPTVLRSTHTASRASDTSSTS